MKKVVLLVIFTVVSFTVVNAQDYKWWAGAKSALWLESDQMIFVFAPEVGYHLTNKFAVAASIGFSSYQYDNNSNKNELILNPYIHFKAINKDNLLFFVNFGVDYGLGDIEGFQVGFKPGMAIPLSNRVTFALQFGFLGYNDGKGIGSKSKGVGFDLSGYQSGFVIFYSF